MAALSVTKRAPHSSEWACGGVLPNFRKEGLTGSQFLDGSYWERGGWPFLRGFQFLHKQETKI